MFLFCFLSLVSNLSLNMEKIHISVVSVIFQRSEVKSPGKPSIRIWVLLIFTSAHVVLSKRVHVLSPDISASTERLQPGVASHNCFVSMKCCRDQTKATSNPELVLLMIPHFTDSPTSEMLEVPQVLQGCCRPACSALYDISSGLLSLCSPRRN